MGNCGADSRRKARLTMKTLDQIRSILSEKKDYLFSHYPLDSLAIFGSFSRNQASEESDLDILEDVSPSIGIRFVDLGDELERILEMKVDLVSKKGVKDRYLKMIEKDLIYV